MGAKRELEIKEVRGTVEIKIGKRGSPRGK
jgi:hypothetical protein